MSSALISSKLEEGSEALLKILQNDRISETKKLMALPAPIFLQIDFIKIPKVTRRIVRIPLKNNILTDSADVCLIVADIIRGRKVNHEVTLNHYKKVLEKKGVMEAQKLHIMSSRQIRVDYASFEAKRKLCKMFDIFLIDNKISAYLRPKLGKEFPKSRKWPIPIRMKRKDLKDEILTKIMKTALAIDGSGTTKTVQVGHVNMKPSEIAENIVCVGDYIAKHFPGGWDNIRTLHIKGLRSIALPIYMSLISKNNVPTPTIKTKKRKRVLASEEVSIVGKKVTVYRSGRVKVDKNSVESDDDAEVDAEILESMATMTSEVKKFKFDNERNETKVDDLKQNSNDNEQQSIVQDAAHKKKKGKKKVTMKNEDETDERDNSMVKSKKVKSEKKSKVIALKVTKSKEQSKQIKSKKTKDDVSNKKKKLKKDENTMLIKKKKTEKTDKKSNIASNTPSRKKKTKNSQGL